MKARDLETGTEQPSVKRLESPTSLLIGFGGRTESSNDETTGIGKVLKRFANNKSMSIVQSTWNAPLTTENGDVLKEAAAAVAKVAKSLEPGEVFPIVIVGYSYGADRAMTEAGVLYDNLKDDVDAGRVEINLILIDAVSSEPGAAHGKPITKLPAGLEEKLHSLTNYYQTEGKDADQPKGNEEETRIYGGPIELDPNGKLRSTNNFKQRQITPDRNPTFENLADGKARNLKKALGIDVGALRWHLAIDDLVVGKVVGDIESKLAGR